MAIKTPYLIQRCTIQKFSGNQKVSEFLQFDYMGSAEFEFGALPKCLREIFSIKNDLKIFRVLYLKDLYVLCTESNIREIEVYLSRLCGLGDILILKEPISIEKLLKKEKPYRRDNFWIDIENYFCFSFDKKALQNFRIALDNSISYMDKNK